jgi:hypothetical protein
MTIDTIPATEPGPATRPPGPLLPLLLLATLGVIAIPLFVRMPLTNDAETYDLQVDIVRRGGVLYRDALEPNLPGVIWVQLAVRSLLGDSPEALKAFDLLVFAGIALLAARLVMLAGGSGRAAAWTALGLAGFYWSQSEWNHCQRDVWMLLPALAAITCRLESRHRGRNLSSFHRFCLAVVEGVFWGCGVWLKPYIVLPAAGVWLSSQLIAWNWKAMFTELAGLLLGGGMVGALGVAWMMHSGCWPYFVDMALHWNREYFAAGRAHWTLDRFVPMVLRFFPWFGLHLVAMPLAVGACLRSLTNRETASDCRLRTRDSVAMLLSAAYVGWLVQSFAFQHLFDYIHAPGVLLSILLLAVCTVAANTVSPLMRGGWVCLAAVAVFWSPCVQPARLSLWTTCVNGPMTPAVRDRLSHFQNPNRQDLARVAEFLEKQGVSGRDVCFFNSDFVGMYRQMDLAPPTRYTYLFEIVRFLPSHHEQVLEDVAAAPHRFVVTDVATTGITPDKMDRLGPNGVLTDAKAQPRNWTRGYPWSCPAVFRAGTYLVHRVDGPIDALSQPAGEILPRAGAAAYSQVRN